MPPSDNRLEISSPIASAVFFLRFDQFESDIFIAGDVLDDLVSNNLKLVIFCCTTQLNRRDKRYLVSNYHEHVVANHTGWNVIGFSTFN